MHFTLVGAWRNMGRTKVRSNFYRDWELACRSTQDCRQSLAIMHQPGNDELRAARRFLIEGIGKGRPISVVSKLRPGHFPPLDQSLLGAGEAFGTFGDSLCLLAEYYLRDFARLARIRGWAGIPLMAAVIASFVLPLPLLWDAGRWPYVGAIFTSLFGICLLGGIPISLLHSITGTTARIQRPRFAWTLALGLEGGLTFADSARLASTVSGMHTVGRHLDAIQPNAIKAMSLTAMLEGSELWPAMKLQVAKADEASEYLSTLRLFAEHLESPP